MRVEIQILTRCHDTSGVGEIFLFGSRAQAIAALEEEAREWADMAGHDTNQYRDLDDLVTAFLEDTSGHGSWWELTYQEVEI